MKRATPLPSRRSVRWVVDSGASRHYTNDISFFSSYIAYDPYTVGQNMSVVANGQLVPNFGKGDVHIKTNKGHILILKDVQFQPSAIENLLSVPELDKQGYISTFAKGKYKLVKDLAIVAEAELNTTSYIIEGTLKGGYFGLCQKCFYSCFRDQHLLDWWNLPYGRPFP